MDRDEIENGIRYFAMKDSELSPEAVWFRDELMRLLSTAAQASDNRYCAGTSILDSAVKFYRETFGVDA